MQNLYMYIYAYIYVYIYISIPYDIFYKVYIVTHILASLRITSHHNRAGAKANAVPSLYRSDTGTIWQVAQKRYRLHIYGIPLKMNRIVEIQCSSL